MFITTVLSYASQGRLKKKNCFFLLRADNTEIKRDSARPYYFIFFGICTSLSRKWALGPANARYSLVTVEKG